jgi:hypothetical protein
VVVAGCAGPDDHVAAVAVAAAVTTASPAAVTARVSFEGFWDRNRCESDLWLDKFCPGSDAYRASGLHPRHRPLADEPGGVCGRAAGQGGESGDRRAHRVLSATHHA